MRPLPSIHSTPSPFILLTLPYLTLTTLTTLTTLPNIHLPSYLFWYYSLTQLFFAIFSPRIYEIPIFPYLSNNHHHTLSLHTLHTVNTRHPNLENSLSTTQTPPLQPILYSNHTIPHIPENPLRPRGNYSLIYRLPTICTAAHSTSLHHPPPSKAKPAPVSLQNTR